MRNDSCTVLFGHSSSIEYSIYYVYSVYSPCSSVHIIIKTALPKRKNKTRTMYIIVNDSAHIPSNHIQQSKRKFIFGLILHLALWIKSGLLTIMFLGLLCLLTEDLVFLLLLFKRVSIMLMCTDNEAICDVFS